MSTKTIRMKKADGEAWVAALRSGEYGQCSNRLSNDRGGYCCLGVLQMVLSGSVERMYEDGIDVGSQTIPSEEWLAKHGVQFRYDTDAGFEILRTIPGLPALNVTATQANDRGTTFPIIAAAIEDAMEFTDE